MRKCCLLSMDDMDGFVSDDQILRAELALNNWQTETVPWKTQSADWDRFDIVLVRTTWDYHHFPDHFLSVIDEIAASKTRLENSADLIKWNISKKYLSELSDNSVVIVPTIFIGKNANPTDLADWQSQLASEHLILKPVISANSDNTFLLPEMSLEAENALQLREYMVQPFLRSIVDEGEFSLFYFDGEFSHAINKRPKPDDFRVQEEHGGVITKFAANEELLSIGEKVLNELDEIPLYARVDLIRGNTGEFQLMELELIEPSLYFRFGEAAASMFVSKLNKRMNEL